MNKNDEEYLLMKADEIAASLLSIQNDLSDIHGNDGLAELANKFDTSIANLIYAQGESTGKLRGTLQWICFYLLVIILILLTN